MQVAEDSLSRIIRRYRLSDIGSCPYPNTEERHCLENPARQGFLESLGLYINASIPNNLNSQIVDWTLHYHMRLSDLHTDSRYQGVVAQDSRCDQLSHRLQQVMWGSLHDLFNDAASPDEIIKEYKKLVCAQSRVGKKL